MLNRKTSVILDGFEKQLVEKCGIVGVWCSEKLAPIYVRKGLSTLQHRGQESAGISILNSKSEIETFNGMGLVLNVLTAEVLTRLGPSAAAIGHNRYSTTGSSSSQNAQPITFSNDKFQISIGHNGNIPDCGYLRNLIEKKQEIREGSTDTYLVAQLLLQERGKYPDWDTTLLNTLPLIEGAFCFVILTSDGNMYGARDPYGIRPFCLGKLVNGWVIASESVALDLIGAEFLRDIKPGEIFKIGIEGKTTSFFFGKPKRPQNCIFEYIYFSRPDSFENGIRVRSAREESGRLLGQRIIKKGIKADAVVPVYESGYPAAKGVAQKLGLPLIDAITVSHYIGRTFIQPGQETRLAAVNGKHNVVPDEIIGKKIIVVDDSVIRLTTSKQLNRALKESGAKKVYIVSASPPVIKHCDMGIDMKSRKELPASQWENEPFEVIEDNVGKFIGCDGFAYLPIEELTKALGGSKEDFYHYPFGGPHPLRDKQYEFPKRKRKIKNKAKLVVFISRTGSNLKEIIRRINTEEIQGEIAAVVSSREDSKGIKYAKENNIPVFIAPFEGDRNDKRIRKIYDIKLFKYIEKINPDIIILAGWTLILGDEFLKSAARLEIPVINLHPALLTSGFEETIASSRGVMPVLRGANAIKEAYDKQLLVSGVSVHQVLPKNNFDTGPVILKEEVRIKSTDTLEAFEKRIHEAEKRVLPTAIKRIIYIMKEGVDVSRGGFFW